MAKKRVALFVDGFNLYHSVKDFGDPKLKWLSLWDLGERILLSQSEFLVSVDFFSAYAHHLKTRRPGIVGRHRRYVRALESTGVRVHMAQFKRKPFRCFLCQGSADRYEEKQTDVNLSLAIVAGAFRQAFDVAYVLTADTDISPALRLVRDFSSQGTIPKVEAVAVIPPVAPGKKRLVAELQNSADRSIKLTLADIESSRLPDIIHASSGSTIHVPDEYR